MTSLIKKEDQDFIVRFLTVYKEMSEENQKIVLAFVQGLELQRTLHQDKMYTGHETLRPNA